MNHLEIEFKSGLTKEQFLSILPLFKNIQPIKQTNYYIDTPDFAIRDHKMALRVRTFENSAELTLKVSQTIGNMEYNQQLKASEVKLLLEELVFPPGEILNNLLEAIIPIENLKILGHLTTVRREMKHKIGLLALDENSYFDITDYEIELEVQNPEKGKIDFLNFLEQNKLPYTQLKSKIARFAKNLPNS